MSAFVMSGAKRPRSGLPGSQRLRVCQGLRESVRRRGKRAGTRTQCSIQTADAPNMLWVIDFQYDSTSDGRPLKILSTVDEHTRECLGGLVERSITADRLATELDRIVIEPGTGPRVVRLDNGDDPRRNGRMGWYAHASAWLAADRGTVMPAAWVLVEASAVQRPACHGMRKAVFQLFPRRCDVHAQRTFSRYNACLLDPVSRSIRMCLRRRVDGGGLNYG
jgi:hypothetical protein